MAIETPIIIINFKLYKEASGEKALSLAKIVEGVSEETGVEMAVAPNVVDLKDVASRLGSEVYAQHVDPIPYGAYTGRVPPQYLKEVGVDGSLINHSERVLDDETIRRSLDLLRTLDLKSVLCAATPEIFMRILGPNVKADAVAIEPPELIGTGRAVSKYKPEIIEYAAEAIQAFDTPLLCGAGIVSGEDVKRAMELGAEGILVASGVVKAKDPAGVLRDFAVNM